MRTVVYRVRIERAWKWPGGTRKPPRTIEVYDDDMTTCGGRVADDERYLVYAVRDSASGRLRLGGTCSPNGPIDATGPMARTMRKHGHAAQTRRWLRSRAAMLDTLDQRIGLAVEPAR